MPSRAKTGTGESEADRTMIPDKKIKAYDGSDVPANKSRHDVEYMLEKQGTKNFAWKKEDPQNTYLLFQVETEGQKLTFKVTVPFIEKVDRTSPTWSRKNVYDEVRSYRFFFHIFKSMLLNTQIGMSMQEVFGNYLVVGQLPNGDPMSVNDKICEMIATNKVPQLTTL